MHPIHEAHNHFYIGNDATQPEGQLQYTIDDKVLTIWHTIIGESLKGQGAGSALVAYAVDYAHKNDLKIKPICTYALSQFEKKLEYGEVWSK
jgi:uncharacterized protein